MSIFVDVGNFQFFKDMWNKFLTFSSLHGAEDRSLVIVNQFVELSKSSKSHQGCLLPWVSTEK